MRVNKVLRIPIEQDDRFEDLLRVWREISVYLSHQVLNILSYSMEDLQTTFYHKLRKIYPDYTSNIIPNAYKFVSEQVKGCMASCKGNKRTRYPNLFRVNSLHLGNRDITFNGERIRVIYKPYERIEVMCYPNEKQKGEIKNSQPKGGRIVKRKDGKFELHLILEKEVFAYQWEDSDTIIGVDIGMNYLAVYSALTRNGFDNPHFIKGRLWRHLQLQKRAKMRVLQSRGTNTEKKWKYYKNRLDEIFHKASKEIVVYAKRFEKPIIVLEDLSKMSNNSRSRKWNFLLGNWARKKLQKMIEYKAEWEGIPVVKVYPHYTSQICHICGSRGERRGLEFYCSVCDKTWNSDANACMYIALRFCKNIRHHFVRDGIFRGYSFSEKGVPTYLKRSLVRRAQQDEVDECIGDGAVLGIKKV